MATVEHIVASAWPVMHAAQQVRRIVIDPGHGGKDPGVVSDDFPDVLEKDVVLVIGRLLKRFLVSRFPTLWVYMTRVTDRYVTLAERVERAERIAADFFLSIHSNARKPDVEVPGMEVETYWYKGSDRRPASTIHRRTVELLEARDRGLKTERFYVLRNTTCPAALVELGFMTDADDVPKLVDIAYQRQLGRVLGEALAEALELRA